MKRFFAFLILGLLCTNFMQAQGIEFVDNITVAEALSKARAEGKLVFVDCYTSWCRPCKQLAKEVFPQKEAGDFFNPRFVSLKLDMEKGEGPMMAKKWDISAYPTLTFLDTKGEVLFQTVGYRGASELVDTVAYLLKNYRPSELAQRYKAGERSVQLVADYIAELKQQHKRNTIEAVASEFVSGNRELLLTDTIAQRILIENVHNPYNKGFLFAYENRGHLTPEVNEAMEYAWKSHTKNFYTKDENGAFGLDEGGMNDYYDFMKQKGVERARYYLYSYKLPASFLMKNKRMILECLEGCRDLQGIPPGQIDMALKALDELELKETERQQYENLKRYYYQPKNKE